MAQAFVTGGSGFIGQVLIRRLVSEGHTVRALVRSEESAAKVAALGADPVRGDLTDPATWQDAVKGSEVVFHLAAETDIANDRARQELVTVRGTQAIVDAARYAGVSRFVHCGTEAAILAGEPLVEADETAPLRPDSEAVYSSVKAEAEAIVLGANTADFTTVSIRPRMVWGPDSILIDLLVGFVKSGRFAWVEGGRHLTEITFVDNCVEGLMLGWKRGRPGQAYFVTDQNRVVFRDFWETMFEIHGVDKPTAELDAATAASSIPVPVRWFLGQECTLRTDKAVAELGYKPIVSYTAGLDAVKKAAAASKA